MERDGQGVDERPVRFGFRSLSSKDGKLRLNAQPYYLRGFSIARPDPLIGMLPCEKEVWVKRFALAKGYGFNHLRWHSTTPPRAAFEAADQVGIFIQAELPVCCAEYLLPNRALLREELARALQTYGHHPSFLALSFGNEFNLQRDFAAETDKVAFFKTIEEFYALGKKLAPQIFIMSNTGYEVHPSDMAAVNKGVAESIPSVEHESGGYPSPDIS